MSQYYRLHPELPKELPIYATKYCSGRFYFLSYESVEDLITKREQIQKEFLEDYAIGFYLNASFKINMMALATNLFFTDIELSDFKSDRQVSDRQVSDRQVSDRQVSDRQVSDRQVSDRQVSEPYVTPKDKYPIN
jgi:hypothetical protein